MRYNNEQYSKLSKIKLNQIELKLSEQNGYYCKSAEDTR